MTAFWFIFIFWIVPIGVAHNIGKSKGNNNGWLLGLLLGWLGVIIVACTSDKRQVALTAKQIEVADLEADLKLTELRAQQAALTGGEPS